MSYRTYQSVGYGYRCRTELTKGLGTGLNALPSLQKGRVRVWMFYQPDQRVGYGTAACTRTRTRPRILRTEVSEYSGHKSFVFLFSFSPVNLTACFLCPMGAGGPILAFERDCGDLSTRPYQSPRLACDSDAVPPSQARANEGPIEGKYTIAVATNSRSMIFVTVVSCVR